jgi:hypothetical protein
MEDADSHRDASKMPALAFHDFGLKARLAGGNT